MRHVRRCQFRLRQPILWDRLRFLTPPRWFSPGHVRSGVSAGRRRCCCRWSWCGSWCCACGACCDGGRVRRAGPADEGRAGRARDKQGSRGRARSAGASGARAGGASGQGCACVPSTLALWRVLMLGELELRLLHLWSSRRLAALVSSPEEARALDSGAEGEARKLVSLCVARGWRSSRCPDCGLGMGINGHPCSSCVELSAVRGGR